MLKVRNSRCISRISAGSLRKSGTRNIIAVLAIALTALMITSLFTIGESAMNSFQQSTMRQVGTSAHGGFKFLSMEQYEKVAKDPKVKDMVCSLSSRQMKKVKFALRLNVEEHFLCRVLIILIVLF